MGEHGKGSRASESPNNQGVLFLQKSTRRVAPDAPPKPEEDAALLHTELEDVELKLRNSQFIIKQLREELSQIMEFSPIGYLALNETGEIESVNTTAASLLQREQRMLRTHPFAAFVTEDSIEAFYRHLADVQRISGKHTVELKIARPDKNVIFVTMESRAYRDQRGRVKIRSGIMDVTERKRLEEDRRNLEEQLRQAHKMEAIGTLAGGIAHDFNNILAAIMGFTELAIDDAWDNPHIRHEMEQVLKAGLRGRDLVRQILAFSRKSEGKRQAVSMTKALEETLSLLRASLPSTIKMTLAITTTDDYVLADPAQPQQVLLNLATNAADAMQERGGELTIELSSAMFGEHSRLPDPDMERGAYVRLAVKDTGCGMTEDVRERVFDPFFTTKERGKGTGMGLAVVYGIVKNHGGAVTVQSRVGHGSTFAVLLPQIGKPEKSEDKLPTAPLSRGTERILFVDDEGPLVETGKGMLESLGYRVTIARDGTEAWNLFSKDPSQFDLVITDQTMPDMTGVVLSQKILKVRKDLPIILNTGYSEAVSAETAKELGISAFTMKPLERKELTEAVRRVLDRKKADV